MDSGRCHEKTLSRKGREIDLWYSGKKKDFGGNIQALFYPDGKPMWVSDVLPGNVDDLAAAREASWRSCGFSRRSCRPWPTAATKAQVTGSSPR